MPSLFVYAIGITMGVYQTTNLTGGIAASAATTVVIIAFLVVIAFVWRTKRQEKHTLVIEMQNTSLLENDYDPPLSLNVSAVILHCICNCWFLHTYGPVNIERIFCPIGSCWCEYKYYYNAILNYSNSNI